MSVRLLFVASMPERPFSQYEFARVLGGDFRAYRESPFDYPWDQIDLMFFECPYPTSRWDKTAGWLVVLWVWEAIRHRKPIGVFLPDVGMVQSLSPSCAFDDTAWTPWVVAGGRAVIGSRWQIPEDWWWFGSKLKATIWGWHIPSLEGPPAIHVVHHWAEQGYINWMQTHRWQGQVKTERVFIYDPSVDVLEDVRKMLSEHFPSSLFAWAGVREPTWFIDVLRKKNLEGALQQIEGKHSWPTHIVGCNHRVRAYELITELLPRFEGTLLWNITTGSPYGQFRLRFIYATATETVLARAIDQFHFLPIDISYLPTLGEVESLYEREGSDALRTISHHQYEALAERMPSRECFITRTWPRVVDATVKWWQTAEQAQELLDMTKRVALL